MNQFQPVLQALLVADHVYTDKQTNKKIVAGIFHNWGTVPQEAVDRLREEHGANLLFGGSQAGSPYVYMSLTEIYDKQDFVLRYVNIDSEEVLFQVELSVQCQTPLDTAELIIGVPSLPPVIGTFAMELVWNDVALGSHRIRVHELKIRGSDDENSDDA